MLHVNSNNLRLLLSFNLIYVYILYMHNHFHHALCILNDSSASWSVFFLCSISNLLVFFSKLSKLKCGIQNVQSLVCAVIVEPKHIIFTCNYSWNCSLSDWHKFNTLGFSLFHQLLFFPSLNSLLLCCWWSIFWIGCYSTCIINIWNGWKLYPKTNCFHSVVDIK